MGRLSRGSTGAFIEISVSEPSGQSNFPTDHGDRDSVLTGETALGTGSGTLTGIRDATAIALAE